MLLSIPTLRKSDAARAWQLGFQDPASPIMKGIIELHHDIMGIMMFVLVRPVSEHKSGIKQSLAIFREKIVD